MLHEWISIMWMAVNYIYLNGILLHYQNSVTFNYIMRLSLNYQRSLFYYIALMEAH